MLKEKNEKRKNRHKKEKTLGMINYSRREGIQMLSAL
jgi:hypothetical protein